MRIKRITILKSHKNDLTESEADKIKRELEAAGATVVVVLYGVRSDNRGSPTSPEFDSVYLEERDEESA